ncbi:MAG: hypothetical protein ACKVQC_10730 [Elusimicrobiota bacterium]
MATKTNTLILFLLIFVVIGCSGMKIKNSSQKKELETIDATGSAFIENGDVIKAQRGALAEAQRSAVEKALGVMVYGRIVVDKAVAVQNRILSRTEGEVKKYDILSEQVVGDVYQIRIKALVSLKEPNGKNPIESEEKIQLFIEGGMKELNSKNVFEALKLFLMAEAEALNDTMAEEARSHIREVLSQIKGELSTTQIPFNGEGRPLYPFEFKLVYGSQNLPLVNWPLKVDFIQSRGRGCAIMKTNEQGIVVIDIPYIDPYKTQALLGISPAWSEMGGSSRTVAALLWQQTYVKQTKLAIRVKATDPQFSKIVQTTIKKIVGNLSGGRFDIQPLDEDKFIGMEADFLVDKDYFLKIDINSKSSKHPVLSLFNMKTKACITLQHLSDGEQLFEDCSLATESIGPDVNVSFNQAFSELELKLINFLKKKMESISI